MLPFPVGTLPCDQSHDAFNFTYPHCEQTDACEGITFPQLCLQVVMNIFPSQINYCLQIKLREGNIYWPQGKVKFSQASVILSTISLMPTRSLLILVGYSVTCYSVVSTHHTGMLSCFTCVCVFTGWEVVPYPPLGQDPPRRNMGRDRKWHHTPRKNMGSDRKWQHTLPGNHKSGRYAS